MDSILDTETHNSNLISFIKTGSDLADHMTTTRVIGMSHGEQEPMESGRYHDIIHWDIIHHDVIHFAFPKMAESQNFWQKYTWLFPSIYTFLGLIFQKPLTCIRNNIILHVYHNLKCNENWWKAAYHASSVPRVVSYALCVCMMSDFWILHHFTPIN